MPHHDNPTAEAAPVLFAHNSLTLVKNLDTMATQISSEFTQMNPHLTLIQHIFMIKGIVDLCVKYHLALEALKRVGFPDDERDKLALLRAVVSHIETIAKIPGIIRARENSTGGWIVSAVLRPLEGVFNYANTALREIFDQLIPLLHSVDITELSDCPQLPILEPIQINDELDIKLILAYIAAIYLPRLFFTNPYIVILPIFLWEAAEWLFATYQRQQKDSHYRDFLAIKSNILGHSEVLAYITKIAELVAHYFTQAYFLSFSTSKGATFLPIDVFMLASVFSCWIARTTQHKTAIEAQAEENLYYKCAAHLYNYRYAIKLCCSITMLASSILIPEYWLATIIVSVVANGTLAAADTYIAHKESHSSNQIAGDLGWAFLKSTICVITPSILNTLHPCINGFSIFVGFFAHMTIMHIHHATQTNYTHALVRQKAEASPPAETQNTSSQVATIA